MKAFHKFRRKHTMKTVNTLCTDMKSKVLRPIAKYRNVSKELQKYHSKVDEALNVMSLNSTMLQAITNDTHIQKYQMTIHYVQNDFLIASKILLLSRILDWLLTLKYPTKVTAAVYGTTLLYIIFASEIFSR